MIPTTELLDMKPKPVKRRKLIAQLPPGAPGILSGKPSGVEHDPSRVAALDRVISEHLERRDVDAKNEKK